MSSRWCGLHCEFSRIRANAVKIHSKCKDMTSSVSRVVTEAEFKMLLLISASFLAATCFAKMTPTGQDKCICLQNPVLIILANMLLTWCQGCKTGQVI
ncbi:hypothetical protein AMECASPLE_005790 [Ameca splendens]|uniref:Uncharacterized protein n=1 Tax=Ameca splendens TaxID=208324 RepID=A0ABV0Z807_9TELE